MRHFNDHNDDGGEVIKLVFHKEPLDDQVARCTIGDKVYNDEVYQMKVANLMKVVKMVKVVILIVENSSQDGEGQWSKLLTAFHRHVAVLLIVRVECKLHRAGKEQGQPESIIISSRSHHNFGKT